MCFYSDYSWDCGTTEHRRARAKHHCHECGKPINPGDEYQYSRGLFEGYWDTFRLCDECVYYRALLYAHERGEGCSHGDSWYPAGDGEMRSYMRYELCWRLPGDPLDEDEA